MTRTWPARPDVERACAFLVAKGYSDPMVTVQSSKLLGESLLFAYRHPAINRRVDVTYQPGTGKFLRSLVVAIVAGDKSFLLEDYLKSIGQADLAEAFAARPDVMTEQVFVAQAGRAFRDVADGPLAPTLAGVEWPRVEFDWKGMR